MTRSGRTFDWWHSYCCRFPVSRCGKSKPSLPPSRAPDAQTYEATPRPPSVLETLLLRDTQMVEARYGLDWAGSTRWGWSRPQVERVWKAEAARKTHRRCMGGRLLVGPMCCSCEWGINVKFLSAELRGRGAGFGNPSSSRVLDFQRTLRREALLGRSADATENCGSECGAMLFDAMGPRGQDGERERICVFVVGLRRKPRSQALASGRDRTRKTKTLTGNDAGVRRIACSVGVRCAIT